ncbi:CDP-alcohol phosphatidyltransferase family protein [Rhodococcus yananensis]|uniref:CDP-alcohol phosphatidyltransferase family protein n=1 Tax=Rhodococcus yananensis TaxID=2879464 RepID=UPI001CF82130|nr:CDP-alcohol phosphatidyltransferase family protein [Rhodococcus yananensis]
MTDVTDQDATDTGADRIVTVPNALSILRLLGVPLFLYLLLGPHADVWALLVLVASGVTDWADGKLARLLDQSSRLGALLDPFVDRLSIVATLIGLVARGILPWWIAAVLIGRELVLAPTLVVYRRRGLPPPQVLYLGKGATFLLMCALPLLLLDLAVPATSVVAHPLGWAALIWGTTLYVWTALLYLLQCYRTARAVPPHPSAPGHGRATG